MIIGVLIAASLLFLGTLLLLRGPARAQTPEPGKRPAHPPATDSEQRTEPAATSNAPAAPETPRERLETRIRSDLARENAAEITELSFAPGGAEPLDDDPLRIVAELMRADKKLRLRFLGTADPENDSELIRARVDAILDRLRRHYRVDPGMPRAELEVGNEHLNPGSRRVDFRIPGT